jgi:hypothetical protein
MSFRLIIYLAFILIGGRQLAASAVPETASPAPALRQDICEIPIRWQVVEVDPRFGLSEDEAKRAIRQAGMLWESAVNQALMFRESSDGIPVRFVYDARQQATQERQVQQSAISDQLERIAAAEAELEALRSELARSRIEHEARVEYFESLSARLEEMAEYWNQRGGAPPSELERLRMAQTEVDAARAFTNAAAAEVNIGVDAANQATDRLNNEIEKANRAREELEERYPAMRVQSGQFIDTRRSLGRLTFTRDQEIRIFHFEDWDHLLLVIAHELGHALGLEHSGAEGALMAEAAVAAPGDGIPEILDADVELLRQTCPSL